jgi:hypothetical protein
MTMLCAIAGGGIEPADEYHQHSIMLFFWLKITYSDTIPKVQLTGRIR